MPEMLENSGKWLGGLKWTSIKTRLKANIRSRAQTIYDV